MMVPHFAFETDAGSADSQDSVGTNARETLFATARLAQRTGKTAILAVCAHSGAPMIRKHGWQPTMPARSSQKGSAMVVGSVDMMRRADRSKHAITGGSKHGHAD